MASQVSKNPPVDIKKRSLIQKETPRFSHIINTLIYEFSKSNHICYCPLSHSVETRHTKLHKKHGICTMMTKSEVIGSILLWT